MPNRKINSRKNFVPHGTPTQLVLYRPLIIIIIYLLFQFKTFNETRELGRCPVRECWFSRVTSSFHTLSAVCCGKLLVFIQYIISIQSRFYGSPVNTFWCLVNQQILNRVFYIYFLLVSTSIATSNSDIFVMGHLIDRQIFSLFHLLAAITELLGKVIVTYI